jgi:hypothetical protein
MTDLTADPPTLAEIARTLADFRQEFRAQISQLVRSDLYAAHREAQDQRIRSLEEHLARVEKARDADESDRAASRRVGLSGLVTGAVSLVVALVLVALR